MQTRDASIYVQTAPIGGWDSKNPLPVMPEENAIELINLIPGSSSVRKRKGYQIFQTVDAGESIETMLSYNTITGTNDLLACVDDDIYKVTSSSANSVKDAGLTILSNLWQSTQFGNKLFLVNGENDIVYYPNGSGDAEEASFTGITTEKFLNVSSYNNRLYFVENNNTSVWYGEVKSIAGDLTEYDLQYLLNKGGYLLYAGSSTNNIGNIQADLFVVITSEGEVLVFQGDYPGSTTWIIVGHFYIPRPMDTRSFFQMGSDLQMITEGGIIALSDILNGGEIAGKYNTVTDNINVEFSNSGKLYKSNKYWQGVYNTQDNLVIINVPKTSAIEQYVMDTTSGGWCKFQNIQALSWVVQDGVAYFGSDDGIVYEYGQVENDDGEKVKIKGRTAFTFLENAKITKLFTMIKPIIKTTEDAPLTLGLNVDFDDSAVATVISPSDTIVAEWDDAEWDDAEWADGLTIKKDWYSIEGQGLNCSILFAGEFDNIELEIFAFYILYKIGGGL